MAIPKSLQATDLFVLLEKEYRRRTRRCGKCGFSLPYRVFAADERAAKGAWSVIPAQSCTHGCRAILEELVSSFQKSYRLSDTGGFRAL